MRLIVPILLILASALTAQSPVVYTSPIDSGMIARHADGAWTCVYADESGVSISTSGHDDPKQDPAPVPVLRTKWIDREGMEQEVSTPIASTSDSGLRRAMEVHERLVNAMKQAHPPRPPS